ncbi:MAG: hypothetical protein CNIPEHKO_01003 [Anaerolineales bacterium]|nr:hypothetical protein [Anaerolineales bacterium]HQU36645.1 hypothetical protein [Anaerolineales bacterium]
MAEKKPNRRQEKSRKALQIVFAVFTIVLILSMLLSAFIAPR